MPFCRKLYDFICLNDRSFGGKMAPKDGKSTLYIYCTEPLWLKMLAPPLLLYSCVRYSEHQKLIQRGPKTNFTSGWWGSVSLRRPLSTVLNAHIKHFTQDWHRPSEDGRELWPFLHLDSPNNYMQVHPSKELSTKANILIQIFKHTITLHYDALHWITFIFIEADENRLNCVCLWLWVVLCYIKMYHIVRYVISAMKRGNYFYTSKYTVKQIISLYTESETICYTNMETARRNNTGNTVAFHA